MAALSAAWNPLELTRSLLKGGESALTRVVTPFVLVPHSDEYQDISLKGATTSAFGPTAALAGASRCVSTGHATILSVLVNVAISGEGDLYDIDLTTGPVVERLSENIASGDVNAPLFLGQGTDDQTIPISLQEQLSSRLCGAGREVATHEYPGRDHMGVIASDSPLLRDLMRWVDQVEDGQLPDNC